MKIVHVKPAEALVIRAPGGDVIPPEGVQIELGMYVQRRLVEGDLILVVGDDAPQAVTKGDDA